MQMPRSVRNGEIESRGLAIAIVPCLVPLFGVWRFTSLTAVGPDATSGTGSRSDQSRLEKSFLDAIRNGDRNEAQRLLHDGANANAYDEAGDTAPMRAGRGDVATPGRKCADVQGARVRMALLRLCGRLTISTK